jgi:uncharacterized protein YycO
MNSTPRPGDFGVVQIHGTSGKLISLGQALIGCPSRFSHAFLVLDNGEIVQGEPGGAKIYPASAMAHRGAVCSSIPLSDAQRTAVVTIGRSLAGTPYSWADYAAIGLQRLGLPSKVLADYVADSAHMICSQLVEYAYEHAGYPLFPAWSAGEVTPGDLAILIGAK